jgi:glycosyltransferase involved in cell wall biosynthesis
VSARRRIAVVPAYNEKPTVVGVLERLAPVVDQLVVVDDGSTDGTRAAIERWLPGHDHVRLLAVDRNQGMSAAYHLAFSHLRARLAAGEIDADDWVVTIDADGQHDVADLAGLQQAAEAESLDALLARRDLSGYPLAKRVGNRILSTWATRWAGAPLLDVESGYRIFRLGALADALGYYRGYRYSETVEVAVVLCRLGYRVRNDVLVPVPLYRSRTRLRDAAIDLAAIPLAARRVGRRRAARPPGLAQQHVQAHSFQAPGGEAVEDQGQGAEEDGPVGDQVPVEPVMQVDDGPGADAGQHPAGD